MGGPSAATEKAQQDVSQQQVAQGEQSQAQSAKLFSTTYPWLNTAGDYYSSLASGDPNKIQTAIAPVAESAASTEKATENQINLTMPRGGAKDEAISEAKIAQGATVGSAANKAYTSAPAALASLSGQGLGLSINEMANAIAGLGQASSTLGTLGNEQAAGKATTLGFIGSLAGAGATAAAAA